MEIWFKFLKHPVFLDAKACISQKITLHLINQSWRQ